MVADADAGAVCERKIGTARDAFAEIVVPALGPEVRGVITEPARVAVGDPLEQGDLSPLGYVVATDLTVSQRLPGDARDGGVETHRLLDDPLRIAEPGNVRYGWQLPGKYLV